MNSWPLPTLLAALLLTVSIGGLALAGVRGCDVSAVPEPTRSYTTEELAALRVAFGSVNDPVQGGPAQYACGPYWPDELERRADALERRVPQLRLAAQALRREIAKDPRCTL